MPALEPRQPRAFLNGGADDRVRSTCVEFLSALGYRVLTARAAASARTVIESGARIDLLFTDVVMPGPPRSPELVRKIRRLLGDPPKLVPAP